MRKNAWCRLLDLPKMGTPKCPVRMGSGMMLMKYRVAERKLQFLNRLRTKDREDVARRTINNEIICGVQGLKHECSQLAKEVNIDDLYDNSLTKRAI